MIFFIILGFIVITVLLISYFQAYFNVEIWIKYFLAYLLICRFII